jgi:quercetin dioxygenase-like cupin family protein
VKYIQSGGKTNTGPAEWFTGAVFVDGLQSPGEDSTLSCAHVRFTPGARTVWHTHPKGQTLYVTDGIGYVGTRGGRVQEIRPGDVVFIGPGEEHWHGATPNRFMSHIALNEADEQGQVVTWLEPVTEADYSS